MVVLLKGEIVQETELIFLYETVIVVVAVEELYNRRNSSNMRV